ncbi:MAG: DinB family protein [Geminicoccaceae bacterium]
MSSLVEQLRAMAPNNAWANHRLHQACAKLSEDEYKPTRTSFFPSIHLTHNHILLVDWYYLDALDDGGRRWRELYALGDDLRRSAAEQTAADRRVIAWCDALSEDRVGATVILNRAGEVRYPERAQDVLAHLFQHDIHHRGQGHAMLAGTAVPAQFDEFFLAQDAPLRAEEMRALGFCTT